MAASDSQSSQWQCRMAVSPRANTGGAARGGVRRTSLRRLRMWMPMMTRLICPNSFGKYDCSNYHGGLSAQVLNDRVPYADCISV